MEDNDINTVLKALCEMMTLIHHFHYCLLPYSLSQRELGLNVVNGKCVTVTQRYDDSTRYAYDARRETTTLHFALELATYTVIIWD